MADKMHYGIYGEFKNCNSALPCYRAVRVRKIIPSAIKAAPIARKAFLPFKSMTRNERPIMRNGIPGCRK
jgi:hypothetical protein